MILYEPNPPGRPTELTQEVINKILPLVNKYYLPAQVARVGRIPRRTLFQWMTRGENDATEGKDTIYAQLWLSFEEKRGNAIQQLVNDILNDPRWQGKWEILKAIDRQNFGTDSAEIRELISIVSKLQKGNNSERKEE